MQFFIMLVGVVGIAYLYLKNKEDIQKELVIAFIMSLIWVYSSGLYQYRDANHILFGVNLFPLVAWTTGLVLLREIYEELKGKHKLLKISMIYVVALLLVEYVGYNYWGIQLNHCYNGLFNAELMHMPTFGQVYYFMAGPAYIWITDKLKVK